MIRRIVIAILVVAFLGFAGFLMLSRRPAIALVERPNPQRFSAE
jgi:hypothetical protein